MVFLPSAELSRMRENQTFPVIKRSSPTLDFLVEVMGGPPEERQPSERSAGSSTNLPGAGWGRRRGVQAVSHRA